MVCIPLLYSRYTLLFLLGIIGALRCSVWFNSGWEFLQNNHKIYSSTLTQILDAFVPMLLAVYFWKISKHWIYFYYAWLVIWGVNWILWFLIPESPRWLVSKQRFGEAKLILNEIAEINFKEIIPASKDIVDDKVYIKSNSTKIVIDNTLIIDVPHPSNIC